jgi:hypothetical protein
MNERSERAPSQPVQCRVCTIYIGEGYEETHPIALPNGRGYVCWRCFESLRRQADKRAAGERNAPGLAR